VQAKRLHSRGKITPFEGRKTVGAPVHTIVRGAFVQRDRALVPDMAGHGKQVTDIQSMPTPNPQNTEMSLSHLLGQAS
jgi:dihydroorotase